MKLNIIAEMEATSIESVVLKYSLNYKDYGHKFLVKYDQIESSSHRLVPSVREARGLILSKELKVMSYPFYRFFNEGEHGCDTINWNTAKVLKKEDGSLIGVYWDWILSKWCVQTSGTADAASSVGQNELTFEQLFNKAVPKNFYDNLEKGNTYIFELCSPYNIVVTPHTKTYAKLLSVRNLETLQEYSWDQLEIIAETINVSLIEYYSFSSIQALLLCVKELPQTEEGYVVVDGSFNRIKVKNPAYVALHHLKGKQCKEELFTVIFKGEVDEFVALMPEYIESINTRIVFLERLQCELDKVSSKFISFLSTLDVATNRKTIALWLQANLILDTKAFMSIYFNYIDNRIDNLDARNIILSVPLSKLESLFCALNP